MSFNHTIVPSNCICAKPWNGVIPPVCPAHPPVVPARQWDETQYTWTGTTNFIPRQVDGTPVNVLDRVPKPSPRRHTGPLKDLLVGMLIGAGIMLFCVLIGFVEVAWFGW
ncbi:MAG: hypothetical protein ACTHJ9_00600 [Rhodanobacter sp.]